MQPLSLSPEAQRLATQLEALATRPAETGPTFHVTGIGSGFYLAYEQLRNAAEYRDHHLLLRSAIERFLTRYLRFHGFEPIAADLVAELTQAGYLGNDTIALAKLEQIDAQLGRYADLYKDLAKTDGTGLDRAAQWLYQIASTQIADLVAPNHRLTVFMAFAYDHYLRTIDLPGTLEHDEDELAYPVALYCAVQRSLFQSDIATTRYYCLAARLPDLDRDDLSDFVRMNRLIDRQYSAPLTNRLARLINRYGAPLRIMRQLVAENGIMPETLPSRATTLGKVERVIQQQYGVVRQQLKKRIIKAILFILITKTLLGVAVEIPYDIAIHGAIAWLPLGLNIAFPLVYMVLISSRIGVPGRHNTRLIIDYIDRILYAGAGEDITYKSSKRVTSRSLRTTFNVVYGIGFTLSFGLVIWALYNLGFNIVNGVIFFVFLSAVSFLGFKLRQTSRELAMVDERQGIIQTLAEFLSTPFVRLGYWLSDRYARLNIVALLLEVAIEMPLKTTLRLIQQWIGFMRDKQEEL